MKEQNNNYSKITSLRELRSERERLQWQKQIVRDRIDMNIEHITSVVTMERFFSVVNEKLAIVRTIAHSIKGIFDYVVSLFRHKKESPMEPVVQPAEQPVEQLTNREQPEPTSQQKE